MAGDCSFTIACHVDSELTILKITHTQGDFLYSEIIIELWCDFTPTLEPILVQSCKSNSIYLARHKSDRVATYGFKRFLPPPKTA